MPTKPTASDPNQDEQLEYEEYDIAYADSIYEDAEYLARRKRKARPKKQRKGDVLLPGIIVRALGHHFEVQVDRSAPDEAAGQIYLCEVRRRLRQDRTVDTLVAVGDRVRISLLEDTEGQIEEIQERKSVS